ncbi:MAG: hypothetical protein ABI790_15645 [Betaproteobacteria bacterium]
MIRTSTLTLAGCLLALAGCVGTPIAPAVMPGQDMWRDQAFHFQPAPMPVGREQLFALDAELLATLQRSGMKEASTQKRVDYLLTLLFGPELKSFPYVGGDSRIAAETWRLRRGDCLSLSILAYSMAKELNLPVQLQEVRVPQYFNRHGRLDFVERHVNVLIRNEARLHLKNGTMTSGNVVIDFEPQTGWLRAGTALTENGVLARYYNNIAADYFSQENLTPAYAWFKAAIFADPGFSSSYSNLAHLYKRKDLVDGTEQLLRHAIALNADDETPVRSLHQLLISQGRDAEAEKYAAMLRARQEKDPYYWIGLGLDHLRAANYPGAVGALERAESLTTGFDEVHRYLAIAYWRSGDQAKAKKQLAVLKALTRPGEPGAAETSLAALSRKISRPPRD